MQNIHVIGMSHIDLGFTTTEEELEELLEIFLERMLTVLDRHPEISYAIEQMAHYKKLKARRPDLFERVKAYVRSGRIEVMGAMASSLETNFPNGECFVRNQQLGLRWARENFGVVPESAWLVDTFGSNAQIPQIYRQFGFQQLFANRFGGDKTEDVFLSEGIDGTRLLVIGKDLASSAPGKHIAFRLCRSWIDTDNLFADGDRLSGGLPRMVNNYIENEEVLSLHYADLTRQRADRPGENWMLSSYHQYVEDLRSHKADYPVVNGDLNPEFTGTFSLRTPLRLRNRVVETQLLEAEKWASLAIPVFNPRTLDEAWWQMAFAHFHDIFSGSHSDATFHALMDKFRWVEDTAVQTFQSASRRLLAGDPEAFACFNGLPWQRTAWIPAPERYAARRIFQDGTEVPSAWRDGRRYCRVTLPAAGAATLSLGGEARPRLPEETDGCVIENEFFRLSFDCRSNGLSLELAAGTPIFRNAGDFLTAQEDIGGFQIETPNGGEVFASSGTIDPPTISTDAMGQRMTLSGQFPAMKWNKGQNRLKWSLDLQATAGEPALGLRLWLDWFGEGTRIRLNIPTLIDSAQGVYEIPFGVVRRRVYRPRGTAKGEWPAHRFVALEDQKKGLALVNRGVAGVEVSGGTLSSTLIRAYYPGPMAWVPPTAETSQNGPHTYDFLLIPYAGSWKSAGVVRQAQEFNTPARLAEGCRVPGGQISLLTIDRENLVLSSVKTAEDGSGDLLIRFYETFGQETAGTIALPGAESACLSDVTEAAGAAISCAGGRIPVSCRPFEIQTIRVKRPLH